MRAADEFHDYVHPVVADQFHGIGGYNGPIDAFSFYLARIDLGHPDDPDIETRPLAYKAGMLRQDPVCSRSYRSQTYNSYSDHALPIG